jgi:hypothetical protein
VFILKFSCQKYGRWSNITVEAESYTAMQGVQKAYTNDGGSGQCVGYIDTGDWMAFPVVTIPLTGSYVVEYRVASPNGGGTLQLRSNKTGTPHVYGTVSIPNTGGWENWQTVSHTVSLNAGSNAFVIAAVVGGWNLNWFRITTSDVSEFVVQKSASDCKRPGPITSGFNEAACDIFQGTWCPNPRSCDALARCIKELTDGVKNNLGRQAFFAYLDGAPKIEADQV